MHGAAASLCKFFFQAKAIVDLIKFYCFTEEFVVDDELEMKEMKEDGGSDNEMSSLVKL